MKPNHPVVYCPCGERMEWIYDHKLRKYCYSCTLEMQIEYAKEILGQKYADLKED